MEEKLLRFVQNVIFSILFKNADKGILENRYIRDFRI